MSRILLLGGTTEAGQLARLLADAGMDAVYSYAGRTAHPLDQPLPMRIGGFGGADGLADYLRAQAISHMIDATHPFADQISRNAIAAAEATTVPILSLHRPPWQPDAGDNWLHVPDLQAAAKALPEEPARVFLAIGRQHLAAFAELPHHWLLRLVDPPTAPLPLRNAHAVVARGPFAPDADEALLSDHAITHIVTKNAGGTGAKAKLIAARRLGLPVVMVDRPALPPCDSVDKPEAAMDWVHQTTPSRWLRGV